VRAYAAQGLTRQAASSTTLQGLTAALHDPSPAVVQAALAGLSTLGAGASPLAATLEDLVPSRPDFSPVIAANALSALAPFDVARAAPLVKSALARRRPEVLRDAAIAAAAFTDAKASSPFRMLADAPITATRFVHIAESGAYDGLPVHRVVSNFVAQGGDPHRDGFGHMAWNLPDEPAPTCHSADYVGIATEGKDTGSCQYIID
jgi:hypothetical protein